MTWLVAKTPLVRINTTDSFEVPWSWASTEMISSIWVGIEQARRGEGMEVDPADLPIDDNEPDPPPLRAA